MEWLLVGIAVVIVVALGVRYVVGKMAAARAAYNLELDREMLRNLKAEIERAREEGRL